MKQIHSFRSATTRLHHRQEGFTLIELMIATLIFTIVLVIATVAIIYVSDVYLKGQVVAQAQDTAVSIETTIAHDFEYTPDTTLVNCGSDASDCSSTCTGGSPSCAICGTGATTPPCGICAQQLNPSDPSECESDEYYFCIGNHIYIYTLDAELGNPATEPASEQPMYSNYGLVEAPTTACQIPADPATVAGAQELLSSHQRLGALTIADTLSGGVHSYSINVTVAYGDDDLLHDPALCNNTDFLNPVCTSDGTYKQRIGYNSSSTSDQAAQFAPDNNYAYACQAESYGGRFCAVSTLTTTVSARIN